MTARERAMERGVNCKTRLSRTLSLRDLLIYGAVVLGVTAPMPAFGVLSERGGGHVVSAILLAMVAMLCTSVSYGRMATAYPSAGSAFTYVAREMHPGLGYMVGWSLALDYVLGPVNCIIWCAEQSHEFFTPIPVFVWILTFALVITQLNLQGIRSSARLNTILVTATGAVVLLVLLAAIHYVFNHPHAGHGYFIRPFYDKATFSYRGLLGGTSIAVLSYLGFDAITTLSEETKNPRVNVPLATVLACFLIGIISAAEVYAAQLVWPASEPFPNVDTAYVWVAARMWAPLFHILGLTILIATFGSGVASQLGGARLLYAMGRSGAIPSSFFGVVDSKHRIPRNCVMFCGAVVLIGSLLMSYELAVEMINFGALIAFIGVNAASLVHFFWRAPRRRAINFVVPVIGLLTCFSLWIGLSNAAKLLGVIWMMMGVAYGMWRTRSFRLSLSFDVCDE